MGKCTSKCFNEAAAPPPVYRTKAEELDTEGKHFIESNFLEAEERMVESSTDKVCYFERDVHENVVGQTWVQSTVTFRSGATYTGEWEGNGRHGYGAQRWLDGTMYQGQWKKSKADGHGIFKFVTGDKYVGQFQQNRAHGLGALYDQKQTVYLGEWRNDLKDGMGCETWADGSKYEGIYFDDCKSGDGIFTWPDGSQYIGSWKSSHTNGLGKFVGKDRRVVRGFWNDSKLNGCAEYRWPDGRKYCGHFIQDHRSGFGVFTWPNQTRYAGYWLRGEQHGRGQLTDTFGMTREYSWSNGKRGEEIKTDRFKCWGEICQKLCFSRFSKSSSDHTCIAQKQCSSASLMPPIRGCTQAEISHQGTVDEPDGEAKITAPIEGRQPPNEAPANCPDLINGCGCEFDAKVAAQSGAFSRSDPIQEHYKKGGFVGSITGAFGDKKTMYCHHITADGQFGPRAVLKTGVKPKNDQEVWAILGKRPCCGRFAYDRATGKLKCGELKLRDHDNTCNKETCLFIASGLECPTPLWALKA